MKIQFIGATHEVTGSCTLLEVGGRQYLVDCGMEQGTDLFENIPIPVPAGSIDAVFLTHAHIDHSGMLPKLYKDGFRGQIYATEATSDLCNIMLRDSAHIQESEAEWRSRKAERAGEGPVTPIYDTNDALGAIKQFRPCKYDEILRVAEGIEVRFTDIGHLLGSACIELWLTEGDQQRKIVFSGDVGNYNQPIINDPKRVEETDYLVIESTYGNRLHEKNARTLDDKSSDAIQALADYIQQTFDRGGSVIIPSFAVGRTQEMLYAIREIKQHGMVKGHDGFPVYVDSPLAVEATAIFLQCDFSCFDEKTMALVQQGVNPLWFDGLTLSVTSEESKLINQDRRPKVILSASGMCEAGRIRHHLKHNLWQENNLILFVGYQAEGSLGRKLQDGAYTVRLFGEDIAVRAQIASLHGTSGHADQAGLVDWLEGFREKPKTVYVNHGDDDACKAFQSLLTEKGYQAEAPYSGTEYDLITGKMTIYADARPISRQQILKGHSRAMAVYTELIAAAEALLTLCRGRKGRTNKENAKLTSQIRSLIDKWRE
ncbi:MAG: MBL fold metallo-hydrolase [Oscillospiraceae bacterium]|nr:MBL fold metallo-hydrolase [Oscillospiraceae bacterium]MBQ9148219.1 MBL fold metallo-hydrolase [Oscillospiraceae bacterium]